MGKRFDNAVGLYLEGIRDGNMREALDKYTGARYTQRSTGVADGKEWFIEFFTPFLARYKDRHIEVVRGFEDGRFVFCHVYQSLDNGVAKWVTADLLDTDDDGRIIEHWDVIQAPAEHTVSGRSMVDGPSVIKDLDKTEQNKDLVRRFTQDVLVDGRADRITDYISTAQYDQHNPHVADGLRGFGEHYAEMQEQGISTRYRNIHHLVGSGDLVVTLSEVEIAGVGHAVFDIFRVADGKILEHWDVQEPIGPPEQWNNSGKF